MSMRSYSHVPAHVLLKTCVWYVARLKHVFQLLMTHSFSILQGQRICKKLVHIWLSISVYVQVHTKKYPENFALSIQQILDKQVCLSRLRFERYFFHHQAITCCLITLICLIILVTLRNFFLSVSFVFVQVRILPLKTARHNHLRCPMMGEVSLETQFKK